MKHLGFGVVGLSYRDAPSSVRSALLKADSGKRAPSADLIGEGKARGLVRVETCSRVEWLVEADEPQWAAELLRGALLARLAEHHRPSVEPPRLHARVGPSAVHHLLRVSAGLDSIAQGEHAVGRQVLKAFEKAHAAGTTGRALNAAWRITGQMLRELREVLPQRQSIGVQALATRTLLAHGVVPGDEVLVFGQGDIGRATARALERAGLGGKDVYRRPDLPDFLERARHARGVVVCSGAPEAWLELPRRTDRPVAVDVGSPAQVRSAEGWESFTLDHLLDEGATLLPDDLSTAVAEACSRSAHELIHLLESPPPRQALAAIDKARRSFLSETLPPLLEGLPPARARAVVARVSEFTHQLIREVSGPNS